MKWWIPLFAVLAMAAADKPADKKATQPAAAARSKTQAAPLKLPEGAVEITPGTYRYTDPQGKKWLYRETPFGLARMEDKPASKDDQASAARMEEAGREHTSAVEDGEYVRFSRPGPFGTYTWRRKKSELDASEKAVWERTRGSAGSNKDAQE